MKINEIIQSGTDLQAFNHDTFGQVRAILIDGSAWFVGMDVTRILGYKNGSRDINRHVDPEDRRNYRNGTSEFNNRGVTVLSLSGVITLALRSGLSEARPFQRWVTSEVLPSIFQHGAYITKDKLDELETNPDALVELTRKLRAAETENARLIVETTPMVEFYQSVFERSNLTTTLIALAFNMSAISMNTLLEKAGIQFKNTATGNWELTDRCTDKGYKDSGKRAVRKYWTQRGFQFIQDSLGTVGIYPVTQVKNFSQEEVLSVG